MANEIVALFIENVEVRQDADGRYCLNDLHKASGGEKRHSPSYWLENSQTKELIAEIRKSLITPDTGIPGSERINNLEPVAILKGFGMQGTFVVKELVYAYAMWISAAFHLKVIRTFDAIQTQPKLPEPLSPPALGKLVVTCMLEVADLCNVPRHYAIQVAAEEATRQTAMPWDRLLTQAKAMNDVPAEDVMLEPTELGKLFGLSGQAMNVWLSDRGLQEKAAGDWVPTEAGQSLCVRHAWVRGNESGYNLKWRAATIEMMWKEAA